LLPEDAFVALGLPRSASDGEIRAMFRTRVSEVHPDMIGDSGHDATLHLLDAYQVALANINLAGIGPEPVQQVPQAEDMCTDASVQIDPNVWLIDTDTIGLGCSHEDAFARLLDVGQSLGAITYLDRQGELIEVLLRTVLGDTISLVISFQGRNDWIEAFLTCEVLDTAKHELPTIEQLTELVADQLNNRW
jgi:hypothetical protein